MLKNITEIRVVGTGERFEVGKAWDSYGMVDAIGQVKGHRCHFVISFASGEQHHLLNCPVSVSCGSMTIDEKSYADMSHLELKAKAKAAGIDISDIKGKGANKRIIERLKSAYASAATLTDDELFAPPPVVSQESKQ